MTRGLTNFRPAELRAHRMNVDARTDRGSMTAERLAEAVGATKAQILAYENGHRVPDPPRVRALARALKIHPWQLMNLDERKTWSLADFRRASGLRAQDVVERLSISPKNYRRFENEGIVPSRRPQFIDEVASALMMPRRLVEFAIDGTPAVQRRQTRVAELVVAMAMDYVPAPGPWRGPAADDPRLIELAAAYGRPVQRLRRVLAYELGELRQRQVRAERERVVADYDTDRARQAGARYALDRWNELFDKTLSRIPRRLERFHRTAQPSEVWQRLVDLYNVDAAQRPDAGNWAVANLLSAEPQALPPYLVEQGNIDDVKVCRLSTAGTSHVATYAGLYAALYPGARKPVRPRPRANSKVYSGVGEETFSLPGRGERLVVPQLTLEATREVVAASKSKSPLPISLSSSYELMVGATSLTVTATGPLPNEDTD
ncbi:helix-turn-helix domain-containing protein [Streptomyces andamanensis]|uniref:Helix-turn-helix domain-containing protein n=1 Tax=Streptomyces andamanensis TaxID=1565035 RepID=A0ABV8T8H5_9ACTN